MKYRIKRFSSGDTKKKKERHKVNAEPHLWTALGGSIGARVGVGKWISGDEKLHKKYLDKVSRATKDHNRMLDRVNEMIETVNDRGFKTRADAEAFTKMMDNELMPRLKNRADATAKGIDKMGKVYKKQSAKNGVKNIAVATAIGTGIGAGIGYGINQYKKNKRNASKKD